MISKKIKIMFFLSLILSLGFITTSLVGYFVAKHSLTEQITQDTLPLLGDTIYSEIQTDLLTPVLISSLMANDTFLQDWVRDGEQHIPDITNYLQKIKKNYHAVTSFFVSAKTLNYYRYNGLVKKVSKDNPVDRWFFHAKAQTESHEVNIDSDQSTNNQLTVFINYKVIDTHGNFLGVTGIGLALSEVESLMREYQKKYNREIFFIDAAGNLKLPNSDIINDIDLNQLIDGTSLKELLINKNTVSVRYIDATSNRQVMLNSRYVEEFHWYLIVKQSQHNYENKIYNSLIVNLLISLLITGIILVIAWLTLSRYQKRLEIMAVTDKLTSLNNRQFFDPILEEQTILAHKKQTHLAVIILDIDDFKAINDQHGHPFGDKVLIAIAQRLERLQNNGETLCRWGGEEFLYLLPNCSQQEALNKAQQIQQAFSDTICIDSIQVNISFSMGIADNSNLAGQPADKLIFLADQALLHAKKNGKNQIICSAAS